MTTQSCDDDRLAQIKTLAEGPNEPSTRGEQPRDLLEWCAWWAGEPHTAKPSAVSPLLTMYAGLLYDWLPPECRRDLVSLIPEMTRTGAGEPDHMVRESLRALALLDYGLRIFVPLALEREGHEKYAARLLRMPVIGALPAVSEAVDVVQNVAHAIGVEEPIGQVLGWVAEGSLLRAGGTDPDLACYCFEPLSLSRGTPVENRCVRLGVDCLRAMVNPRRTARGWVLS